MAFRRLIFTFHRFCRKARCSCGMAFRRLIFTFHRFCRKARCSCGMALRRLILPCIRSCGSAALSADFPTVAKRYSTDVNVHAIPSAYPIPELSLSGCYYTGEFIAAAIGLDLLATEFCNLNSIQGIATTQHQTIN